MQTSCLASYCQKIEPFLKPVCIQQHIQQFSIVGEEDQNLLIVFFRFDSFTRPKLCPIGTYIWILPLGCVLRSVNFLPPNIMGVYRKLVRRMSLNHLYFLTTGLLLCLGRHRSAPVNGQYHDDPGLHGSVPGYGCVGPSALSPLEVQNNQVLLESGCHPGLQVKGFPQD